MPTYEYRCSKCGVFEMQQKITAPPLEKCPTCGEPVRRLISNNVAIIYNGSGYYTTDNRSQDYKEKAKQEKGDTSTSSSDSKKSKVS
jgi:putative FmdB family regulatory protein